MEAEYPLDLSTCAERARLAFLALAIATTGEERRATWARLDGLTRESVPVRISMERGSLKHTRVVFGAGNEKSEENQAFVQRMKEAFERAIPPTRSAEPGPR